MSTPPFTEPFPGTPLATLTTQASQPPDVALLTRYFAECAGTEATDHTWLSEAEQRWAVIHLENSPAWQVKWFELEEAFGDAVPWEALDWPVPTTMAPALAPAAAVEETRPALRRVPLSWRMAVAASFVLFAVYGVLWSVGRAGLPDTYALAQIDGYEAMLTSTVRSEAPQADPFTLGAQALAAAPQSTLGLFPRYNQARVEEAIGYFVQALDARTDPFLRAEAAFFLAKAYLMQGRTAEAQRWLQHVLDQSVVDFREEARALLTQLSVD